MGSPGRRGLGKLGGLGGDRAVGQGVGAGLGSGVATSRSNSLSLGRCPGTRAMLVGVPGNAFSQHLTSDTAFAGTASINTRDPNEWARRGVGCAAGDSDPIAGFSQGCMRARTPLETAARSGGLRDVHISLSRRRWAHHRFDVPQASVDPTARSVACAHPFIVGIASAARTARTAETFHRRQPPLTEVRSTSYQTR